MQSMLSRLVVAWCLTSVLVIAPYPGLFELALRAIQRLRDTSSRLPGLISSVERFPHLPAQALSDGCRRE